MIKSWQLKDPEIYYPFDLKIVLKPTFRCNQKCYFCEEYDNSSYQWSLEDCKTVIEKLKEIPKHFKKIWVYFYGGEPTLSKHLEFLVSELYKIFSDRELFVQIQTNLSISKERLYNFKYPNLEFCSSYHLNKQTVEDFIERLDILNELNIFGYVFINTEIENESQFISEFNKLIQKYPDKIKLRFTVLNWKENPHENFDYFSKKYPYLLDYLEQEFTFLKNGKEIVYDEAYNSGVYKEFYLARCECSSRSLVIRYDLQCFHCMDYSAIYNNIKGININDLDLSKFFFNCTICRVKMCHNGLEFRKYRS